MRKFKKRKNDREIWTWTFTQDGFIQSIDDRYFLSLYYEGNHVGTRRADFVVENKVIVELKALINLEDVHLAQAKNYVVAYKFEKGLLIKKTQSAYNKFAARRTVSPPSNHQMPIIRSFAVIVKKIRTRIEWE